MSLKGITLASLYKNFNHLSNRYLIYFSDIYL